MLMKACMIENHHASSATEHTLSAQNVLPEEGELYLQGSILIAATKTEARARSRSFDGKTEISEVAHSRAQMRHNLGSRNN